MSAIKTSLCGYDEELNCTCAYNNGFLTVVRGQQVLAKVSYIVQLLALAFCLPRKPMGVVSLLLKLTDGPWTSQSKRKFY